MQFVILLGSLISSGSLWLALMIVNPGHDNKGFVTPLILGTGFTLFYAYAAPTWYAHTFPRLLLIYLLVKLYDLKFGQVFLVGLIMNLCHLAAAAVLIKLFL